MPVSTHGAGSGSRRPDASRLNCMNTRFHTSSQRSHSHSTPGHSRPASASGQGRLSPWKIVDLGAGAAGAGVAHRPEVVLGGQLEDAVRRHVGEPVAVRLRVARDAVLATEDRDLQAVGREAEGAGQERPRVLDRVLLEVVAEGEVAEHLEERVVARRDAHVLEVVVLSAGADALLRRGRARVLALLPAQEDVLELVHAGVREQQRGIALRNERRALHDPVPALLEEAEERRPDLVRRHRRAALVATHARTSLALTSARPAPPAPGRPGRRPSAATAARSRSPISPAGKPRRTRNAHRPLSLRSGGWPTFWRQYFRARRSMASASDTSARAVRRLLSIMPRERPFCTRAWRTRGAPVAAVGHSAAGELLAQPGIVEVALFGEPRQRALRWRRR